MLSPPCATYNLQQVKWNYINSTQSPRNYGSPVRCRHTTNLQLFFFPPLSFFSSVVGLLLLLWLVKFVQLALPLAGFYLFASSELSDDRRRRAILQFSSNPSDMLLWDLYRHRRIFYGCFQGHLVIRLILPACTHTYMDMKTWKRPDDTEDTPSKTTTMMIIMKQH